jgi:hypothetical protein
MDRPGAFRALLSIKANLVTFGKALKAFALDSRVVDKSFRPIIIGNKAKSFTVVKPFYSSLGHESYLLMGRFEISEGPAKKKATKSKVFVAFYSQKLPILHI